MATNKGSAMSSAGAKRLRSGERGVWDRTRSTPERVGESIADGPLNMHRKPRSRGAKTQSSPK